jgi:hypothetical protein
MTLLQEICLACTFGFATFSVAADLPKTILPDNVVLCQPSSGCTDQTLFGRRYKVLMTPSYTVMVSVSTQGGYTRADVSIANNTGYPLNLTPDDFRVEVVYPKPRVLLYVPPADLKGIPLPPTLPRVDAAPASIPAAADGDAPDAATKKKEALQEVAEQAAALQNLPAAAILPNEIARGRVYFERDKHSHLVNVVLPLAGVVFEFPYDMKP